MPLDPCVWRYQTAKRARQVSVKQLRLVMDYQCGGIPKG